MSDNRSASMKMKAPMKVTGIRPHPASAFEFITFENDLFIFDHIQQVGNPERYIGQTVEITFDPLRVQSIAEV